MGNGPSRVVGCFVPPPKEKDGVDMEFLESSLDEGLGHSFCYVRPPAIPDSLAITPSNSDRYCAAAVESGNLESSDVVLPHELAGEEVVPAACPVQATGFRTISGASVSANASSARTGNNSLLMSAEAPEPAAAFESTASFSSVPLQPVPRGSGPLNGFLSGPLERGFASGPLEKGAPFMSGPLDKGTTFMSGPLTSVADRGNFSAPLGSGWRSAGLRRLVRSMTGPVRSAISRTMSRRSHGWMGKLFFHPMPESKTAALFEPEYCVARNLQWAHGKAGEDRVQVVLSEDQGWLFVGIYDGFSGPDAPDFLMSNLYKAIDKELEGLLWDYDERAGKTEPPMHFAHAGGAAAAATTVCLRSDKAVDGVDKEGPPRKVSFRCQDEVQMNEAERGHEVPNDCHVEQTPDADEIIELHCESVLNCSSCSGAAKAEVLTRPRRGKHLFELLQMELLEEFDERDIISSAAESRCAEQPSLRSSEKGECSDSIEESGRSRQSKASSFFGAKLCKVYRKQKSLRKFFPWSYDWHRTDPPYQDEITGSMPSQSAVVQRCMSGLVDHEAVLNSMKHALECTEEAYMRMVEKELDKNPELALMGSCVLVMLMKGQDVYVMNLGDSRVILAQDRLGEQCGNANHSKCEGRHQCKPSVGRAVELGRISEDSPMHNPKSFGNSTAKNRELSLCKLKMRALQLSSDHSTSIEKEVLRIKEEIVDDPQAVFNGRVKGQLKVTRAFGAGFLKKPKFNEALLEMFRVDYVGSSSYISSVPSVCHHRLSSSDRFLVLSSDGLYQYFSNEEVVSHVSWFMENVPEGDPAQYLVAELLCRAAKKNGMDFHELLDIPQGERRKYHDDVSVMVVSLEGRSWRSSTPAE